MRKNNTTEYLHVWRRRAMGALGALVIAASVVAVTTSAALAQMACNWPPEGGSNTCLTLENQGAGIYNVRVGIDVYMSQQEAQYLIDVNGGLPFGVEVLAHDHDDPADDTSGLVEVNEIYQVSAGANGLFGNFERKISCHILNEDKDGRDEVVVRVSLYDPRYPKPRQFHSGIIVGYYEDC